jgi:homoserine acetyltransferase
MPIDWFGIGLVLLFGPLASLTDRFVERFVKKMMGNDYETYKLGDFKLQSGEVIKDAFIAYKTYGNPKSPAVIYPTWYSGC